MVQSCNTHIYIVYKCIQLFSVQQLFIQTFLLRLPDRFSSYVVSLYHMYSILRPINSYNLCALERGSTQKKQYKTMDKEQQTDRNKQTNCRYTWKEGKKVKNKQKTDRLIDTQFNHKVSVLFFHNKDVSKLFKLKSRYFRNVYTVLQKIGMFQEIFSLI